MGKMTDTPRTDDLIQAVLFMERFKTFLRKVKAKTGLDLQYNTRTYYMQVYYKLPDGKDKAFCYIDLETGGIRRANGMNGPVYTGAREQARGNVYDDDYGVNNVDENGPKKLHNGKPKGFKHGAVIPRPNRKDAKWIKEQQDIPAPKPMVSVPLTKAVKVTTEKI